MGHLYADARTMFNYIVYKNWQITVKRHIWRTNLSMDRRIVVMYTFCVDVEL